MKTKSNLFFELIQLSVGTRKCLSFVPTAMEWTEALNIARKQAMVGVCFMGLQRAHQHDEAVMAQLPMPIKMQWLTLAANIKKCNEVMNYRCTELYNVIKKAGYQACVLKGQAVAMLYDEVMPELSTLRQSGDIDMWMLADADTTLQWAKATGTMYYFDYHHADLQLFQKTEVELHYRPSISRNLWRNSRLQRWFRNEGCQHVVYNEQLGFGVPDDLFGLVLTLNHNLWHLLYEGVGLRQMMDLYFVARATKRVDEAQRLLQYFGLKHFAAASAWLLWQLFDDGRADSFILSTASPLPPPNEQGGRFLLYEIMLAGNFGHYDERLKQNRYAHSRWGLMVQWMRHTFRLVRYYPVEVLWTPFGILRISLWRRMRVRKYRGIS